MKPCARKEARPRPGPFLLQSLVVIVAVYRGGVVGRVGLSDGFVGLPVGGELIVLCGTGVTVGDVIVVPVVAGVQFVVLAGVDIAVVGVVEVVVLVAVVLGSVVEVVLVLGVVGDEVLIRVEPVTPAVGQVVVEVAAVLVRPVVVCVDPSPVVLCPVVCVESPGDVLCVVLVGVACGVVCGVVVPLAVPACGVSAGEVVLGVEVMVPEVTPVLPAAPCVAVAPAVGDDLAPGVLAVCANPNAASSKHVNSSRNVVRMRTALLARRNPPRRECRLLVVFYWFDCAHVPEDVRA
jgi:hypothetical protein